ncbi:hypothetical protein [Mesorhizobium sp. SARCC-RB16n]|uniref:hypothetical protein n=1 Tax=Mesorhizobium sp. SARCC-RB16n TaxID=2116687 RepID=UPI00122F3B12|nr:hypothetical protein [Mesorhizobium sp. SARCC-RB16n]
MLVGNLNLGDSETVLWSVTAEHGVAASARARRIITIDPVLHQELELTLNGRLIGNKDKPRS